VRNANTNSTNNCANANPDKIAKSNPNTGHERRIQCPFGIDQADIRGKAGGGDLLCVRRGTLCRATDHQLYRYAASFLGRDEDKGNAVETEVTYDPLYGEYLYRLQVGTYGISVDVVLGENYPTPGDYTSFTQVIVEEGQPILNQDLALTRIIHLTSPFDNIEPWDIGFDRQKQWDTPLLESKTVLFSWDAIPEAIAYHLTITEAELNPEKNLQWKNIQTHFDDRITDTSLEIELPSNPEDHFYSARMYAMDMAGNYVGSLMIRLKNGGWGWDMRFRVP